MFGACDRRARDGSDAGSARTASASRCRLANATLWPGSLQGAGPSQIRDACGKEASAGDSIESDPELNPAPLSEQENRAAAIAEVASKLFALDRYERRALSRRKFAIRDWDDYEARRKRNEADCAVDSPSQEIDPNAAPRFDPAKRARASCFKAAKSISPAPPLSLRFVQP